MIENQIYNLLIIQTIGPIVGDVLKNIIGDHKSILTEFITINTLLVSFGVYYLWKYYDDIKYYVKNIINKKKVIYKLEGSIHYGEKEILKHNHSNIKNIGYVFHYIINVIKPNFTDKTTFTINTVINDMLKVYRVPHKCNFKYEGNEFELTYKEDKDATETKNTLYIKAKNYDIIDELLHISYTYHKETFSDLDNNNYKNYIYMIENQGNRYMSFNRYKYKNISSFDNLFLDKKKELLQHLKEFKDGNSKHKFISLLLQGKPGTGKTSVIKMMANFFNRSIVYVKLNEVKNMKTLLQIIHNDYYEVYNCHTDEYDDYNIGNNKIIVFEDIDACSEELIKKREIDNNENNKKHNWNDDDEYTLTFDDILNALNGVIPNDELIFVMTTNHVEKIDNALIRPGRITLNLALNEINNETICLMINKYYPHININKIKTDFALKEIIPCILENIIKNTSSYEELINILNDKELINEYNLKYKN